MMRRRGVLVGAMIVTALTAAPAYAYDDGYQNVVSSVLTAVGLMKADVSPAIDYRERAPLVLPPKMDLDKPVPAEAGRTAAWPKDPDVAKRRKEAEEARAPLANILGNPNDRLSKEELMKGRAPAAADEAAASGEPASTCGNKRNQRGCLVLSPTDLAAEHARYEAAGGDTTTKKELVAGQEPDRQYLTQPPKGYMKVTKTVRATTEAPVGYVDQSNPNSALVYRKKDDE